MPAKRRPEARGSAGAIQAPVSDGDALLLELPLGAEAPPASPTRAPKTRGERRPTRRSSSVAETPTLGDTPDLPLTVSDITAATQAILEGGVPPLWVKGEVTGFKAHGNGHWYFTLRDSGSQIRCVAWASDRRRIPVPPDEGMEVVVRGQLTVYAARGDLQLRVLAMQGIGDGLWRKAFETARARLAADGLLDASRKRQLPPFPRCVALVTSADGAALHDVVAVMRRRNPIVRLVVVHAAVQGDSAVDSLCEALDRVARWQGADVVIIGRGGGGREDLWAFNEERVARAVAALPVPCVSAVGHEVDVTLCDLVADYRAPTPSAAAEATVPVLADIVAHVRRLGVGLERAVGDILADARKEADQTARRASLAAQRLLERNHLRVQGLAGQLHALSPVATMARGYVLAYDASGLLRTTVQGVLPGMPLRVVFHDGSAETIVQRVDDGPAATGEVTP